MDKMELEKILLDQRLDFLGQDSWIARDVQFKEHLLLRDITVITGVRRCGKSTLLREIAEDALKIGAVFFINFDDPRLRDFEAKDFEDVYLFWFKALAKTPDRITIFMDEVQNVESWEQWATLFSRKKNHKVFITGSNSKLLSSEFSTFLTGRHLDIHLGPLAFKELACHHRLIDQGSADTLTAEIETEKLFEHYMFYGGFPRVVLDKNFSYLPHYYQDIITKDILYRNKIRNKTELISLTKILASETTRLFNASKTARLLGLKDEATVRKFCRLLVESYLYIELKCFSYSLRKQTRSLSKFYAVDHALARINGFWKEDDKSRALEILVCSELLRRGHQLFYWKSQKDYEVDFLTVKGIEPTSAIQVCFDMSGTDTLEREIRALEAVAKELGVTELMIVNRYEERIISLGNVKIEVVPVVRWLLR